jgi:hypothetical protein
MGHDYFVSALDQVRDFRYGNFYVTVLVIEGTFLSSLEEGISAEGDHHEFVSQSRFISRERHKLSLYPL